MLKRNKMASLITLCLLLSLSGCNATSIEDETLESDSTSSDTSDGYKTREPTGDPLIDMAYSIKEESNYYVALEYDMYISKNTYSVDEVNSDDFLLSSSDILVGYYGAYLWATEDALLIWYSTNGSNLSSVNWSELYVNDYENNQVLFYEANGSLYNMSLSKVVTSVTRWQDYIYNLTTLYQYIDSFSLYESYADPTYGEIYDYILDGNNLSEIINTIWAGNRIETTIYMASTFVTDYFYYYSSYFTDFMYQGFDLWEIGVSDLGLWYYVDDSTVTYENDIMYADVSGVGETSLPSEYDVYLK